MNPMQIALPILLSALSGFGGKDEKFGSTFDKGALSTLQQVQDSLKGMKGAQDITKQPGYQTGLDWLQSMFNDPQFFNQFEAPLQRQFQEQTVPDLANRFASMGSGGSLGSTGFRNQLAREGSNLSTNLAALRGGMQQQAIPQLLGYSQQPFNNYMQMLQSALTPTRNQYQPAQPGMFANVTTPFAGAAAQGFGQQYGQQMANMMPGQSPSTY